MMLFDRDNWQEILDTLRKNRLRSFMTAFGVFWGIFLLIIMLGAGNGLYNGAMNEFSRLASNSVFIWTRPTTQSYKGFPKGRRFYFNNEDIRALRQQIPEIKYIAPRNQLGGHRGVANVTRGLKEGAFNINGDYPEIIHIKLMDVITGRFLNHLDLKEKRKMAVIGRRVLEVLFEPDEDPIGKIIETQGVSFKIVGVFKSKGEGDEAEEETQTVFIPFTTFQQAFNYGNRVSWFSLTSIDGVPASEVENKAIRLLARRHQVSPDDKLAFGRWNTEKEYNRMKNLFTGIHFLTWFVGIFTLLAGVIGVSNIMLVVVRERTREIGIKRAIGATPFAVVSQIVMEAILLTTSAGYFGLVVGVGAVELVSSALKGSAGKMELFKNPEVDLTIAVIALAILVVSGAVAGLIPGRQAIRVKPVEAIRTE
jgi:putative ABC transport system permease protein